MVTNADMFPWKRLACAVIMRAVKDTMDPRYRDDAIAFLCDEDSIWFAVVDLGGEWRTPGFWRRKSHIKRIERRLERIKKQIQKAQLQKKAGSLENAGKAVACYAAGAR